MGREVRMVPATWEHPKDASGSLIPLYDGSYPQRAAAWDEENAQWERGLRKKYTTYPAFEWVKRDDDDSEVSFSDWDGNRPVASDYMPDWPDAERTHFQMYEDTSDGTPISPPMETPEILARWLADNNANAFGRMTATYEEWLATIKQGWTCSAVFTPETGLTSGVAASITPAKE